MADVRQQFPEISAYLDDSPEYELSSSEFKRGSDRYLLVTQKGPQDGQQVLFVWNDDRNAFEFRDNDTFLDVSSDVPSIVASNIDAIGAGTCTASSATDHDTVHQLTKSLAGEFDSSSGPDHGNLACVWVVRHVIKKALNRWVTQTDGTAVFDPELKACFGHSLSAEDVLPGGIILSPTQSIPGTSRRNIGHIGLLGAGNGNSRLIYSNSSAHAKLEQNFNVGTWIHRYKTTKGLPVHFFPIPLRGAATS
jgi:hypothetical protein